MAGKGRLLTQRARSSPHFLSPVHLGEGCNKNIKTPIKPSATARAGQNNHWPSQWSHQGQSCTPQPGPELQPSEFSGFERRRNIWVNQLIIRDLVGFGKSDSSTSPTWVTDHNCVLVDCQLVPHEWQPDGAETLHKALAGSLTDLGILGNLTI